MSDVIITTDDVLDYLKIPDFDSRQNQEVSLIKITQEATFVEEFKEFTTFQNTYNEVSIPQTIYIDKDNVAYIIYRLSDETIYYKLISSRKDERVFSNASFSSPLVEITIPDEIYNGGYQFYINKERQLVASVEVVTINNTKNFISYNPENFSYLRQYPTLSYTYKNVYGASAVQKIQVTSYNKKGPVHRFPILSRSGINGYTYRLSYYYKENSDEVRSIPVAEQDEPFIGFSILLKDITSVLSFLNDTIFWFYNEYNDYRSSWRNRFLNILTSYVVDTLNTGGNSEEKVRIIFHLPQPMYFAFNSIESLWALLHKLAKGYIRNNLSINEEDLILKILRILYHRKIHRLREFPVNGNQRFEEVTRTSIKSNNEFIANLITRKVDNIVLLYKLITGLDGQQFRTYISFIWNIWKNSSYSVIDPQQNEKIAITEKSPVILDYRSNKTLGFYIDNASITWEGKEPDITISVKTKTGIEEETETFNIGDFEKPSLLIEIPKKEAYKTTTYNYHPFSPIIIQNSENPKFLLKDNDDQNIFITKLPAFVLFGNKEAAFWQNVITGLEYGIDIITTVSGFGNIIKAGRIFNILKGGKTILFKTAQVTKTIGTVKAAAGAIEVSSGTVNALLKLTGANDTKLGKTIAKYLFYLEMLSLAGEASLLLKGKLTKTAKELVDNPKFEKSLDDLVKKGEIDKVSKLEIKNEIERIGADFAKFSRNINLVRLRKLNLDEWRKIIESKGGKLRFIDESKEIENLFKKEKYDAMFRGWEIPPTIWIRRNTTDLVLFHETMHFEDFLRRGAENYLRGATRQLKNGKIIEVPKRDELIRSYLREKFVLEKVLEEQDNWVKKFGKGRWSDEEIQASIDYFYNDYYFKCLINNIDVTKLKLK